MWRLSEWYILHILTLGRFPTHFTATFHRDASFPDHFTDIAGYHGTTRRRSARRQDRQTRAHPAAAARAVADRTGHPHRRDVSAGAEIREGYEPHLGRPAAAHCRGHERAGVVLLRRIRGQAEGRKRASRGRRLCLPPDRGGAAARARLCPDQEARRAAATLASHRGDRRRVRRELVAH